jgi:hypothetical protein
MGAVFSEVPALREASPRGVFWPRRFRVEGGYPPTTGGA